MLTQLVLALAMHGTATKLQNARKIAIDGVVKGEANFDGSGNVIINTTQNNIVVIEGQMVLRGSTTGEPVSTTKEINFPSGFNKDNCFVTSIGTKILTTGDGFGYGSPFEYDVFCLSENLIPCYVMLTKENKIRIVVDNFQKEMTLTYQIVLIKK